MKTMLAYAGFFAMALVLFACSPGEGAHVSDGTEIQVRNLIPAKIEPLAGAAEDRFTPDGVSAIPAVVAARPARELPVLPSYIGSASYTPDGVGDLGNLAIARISEPAFTPDGVSWVTFAGGLRVSIAGSSLPSYLVPGYTPNGIDDLSNRRRAGWARDVFTPDGVSLIAVPE